MEFQGLRPNMKIMQWKFESLKPIFVKTAKECDKKSCLCRRHVEIKILFGDCMKLCKAVLKNKDRDEAVCVPLTIAEAAEVTLCPNEEDAYHKMQPVWCPFHGTTSRRRIQ